MQQLQKAAAQTPLTLQNWQEKWSEVSVSASTPLTDIVAGNYPSVCTLNKGKSSTKNGIIVFKVFIGLISEYMGVEWSDFQRDEAAETAFSEYYYLSLPELKLFFARLKANHFTRKDLSRFAPIHLMAWLDQFAGEVLSARRVVADRKPQLLETKINAVTGKEEKREPLSDEQMGVLKSTIAEFADGMSVSPVTNEELEEEYRRAKNDNYRKTIQKRIAAGERKADFQP